MKGPTSTNTSSSSNNRLYHSHDSRQTPLHIRQLSLDSLLLTYHGLHLLIGLLGLELTYLLFILLRPEALALADGALGLAVCLSNPVSTGPDGCSKTDPPSGARGSPLTVSSLPG